MDGINSSYFLKPDPIIQTKPEAKPQQQETVETSTNNNVESAENSGKKRKKEVVYVSKNPEAAANAAGVVAGTAGMTGGAILGGIVGASKLPGEYVKQVATQDYQRIVKDTFTTFKASLADSPQFKDLIKAIKEAKSPQVSEELINIVNTLSERLHQTFKGNPDACAVLDKIVDPFIKQLSVKKNIRNYGSMGVKNFIHSPAGQTIAKILGFNKKTSKIAGDITGNLAEGIAKIVENIRNFTPAEKEAWKNVSKEILNELEKNPKINLSTNFAKAIRRMIKNPNWITEPFKTLKETLVNVTKGLNKSLGNAPIKTIGLHSAIGAVVCGIVSVLGWLGLKKTIMKKEVKKAEAAEI